MVLQEIRDQLAPQCINIQSVNIVRSIAMQLKLKKILTKQEYERLLGAAKACISIGYIF